jgi:hypothetical protein
MKSLLLVSAVCVVLAGCKEDAAAKTAALRGCMMPSSEASVDLLAAEVMRCMNVAGYDHAKSESFRGHRPAFCGNFDDDFDRGILLVPDNRRWVRPRSDAEQLRALNPACFRERYTSFLEVLRTYLGR